MSNRRDIDAEAIAAWDMAHEKRDYRMPTPKEVAFYLPAEMAEALVGARLGPDGYRVGHAWRDQLFARGLVGARSMYLTAFGHAVRRVLLEDEG